MHEKSGGGAASDDGTVSSNREILQALIQSFLQSFPLAIFTLNREGKVGMWNSAAERTFGWSAWEVRGCVLPIIPAEEVSAFQSLRSQVLRGESFAGLESVQRRKDGAMVDVNLSVSPLHDSNNRVIGIICVVMEIHEHAAKRMEAGVMEKQHEALASLALYGLEQVDLDEVLRHVVAQVARTLETDIAQVFEAQGDELILRAAYGWPDGSVGAAVLDANVATPSGRAYVYGEPVVVEDFAREVRFSGSDLEDRGAVASGALVTIQIDGDKWGVVGVYSETRRDFSEHEIAFLHSVADLVSRLVQRKRFEDALEQKAGLLERFGQAVTITDDTGAITYWNRAAEQMFGWSAEEVLGRDLLECINGTGARQRLNDPGRVSAGSGRLQAGELQGLHRNGHTFPVIVNTVSLYDHQGNRTGTVVVCQDISRYKETETALRESEAKFRALFDNIQSGIYQAAPDGRLLTANPALVRTLGYDSEAELLSADLKWDVYADPSEFVVCKRLLEENDRIQNVEAVWKRKDGERIVILHSAYCVYDQLGRVWFYEGTVTDITELKEAQAEIEQLAHYDSLTRIPNRRLFHEQARQLLALASRQEWGAALLYLDLDRFKDVNDTRGHEAGDELLRLVVERLKQDVRESDVLARLHGDEFVVLLSGAGEEKAIQAARRHRDRLNEPFQVQGQDVTIGVSIGIALYPRDGHELEELLRNADAAMYRAKGQGSGFEFVDPYQTQHMRDRLRLESDLQQALDEGNLVLQYQVVMDWTQNRVSGVEALVQWQRGDSLIRAGDFIPMAEETGLVGMLDRWVLREVARQLRNWDDRNWWISVNISMTSFRDPDFVNYLKELVTEFNTDPSRLRLEIPDQFLGDPEQSLRRLREFEQLGIGIVVDGFGTGYCSLTYLRQFPVDALKVAQSIVHNVQHNDDNAAIVRSVLALAQSLGLKAMAQAVESQEQLEWLRSRGFNLAQGYFIGRPVSADSLKDVKAVGECASH